MIKKYSIRLYGHATSLTLEPPFWDALKEIAANQDKNLTQLIEEIDQRRLKVDLSLNGKDDGIRSNLSSALRVYILNYYRSLSSLP